MGGPLQEILHSNKKTIRESEQEGKRGIKYEEVNRKKTVVVPSCFLFVQQ
jgi:hypothetical protein